MKKILVWDLPVRLLHWVLAASILGAFVLANQASDDSAAFAWHAMLGLLALLVTGLRLAWGVAGTRYARFGSFSLRPTALLRYLRGVLTGRPAEAGAGHNPATSWFAIALFAAIAGLGLTGYLMGRGNERVEALHEALAWTTIGLVAAHVAGLLLHVVRTRENVVASMVTGRRSSGAGEGIPSARAGAAVVLLGLVAAAGAVLVAGFDAAGRRLTLPLTGTVLTIGEAEADGAGPAFARAGEEGEANGDGTPDADDETDADDD